MKNFIFSILVVLSLEQKFIKTQPVNVNEENEQHIDNRLQHYVQRFDIIAKRVDPKFTTDLKNLKSKFEEALAKDSKKIKSELLENYETGLSADFAEYISMELDKQYLNEDILIHKWYIQEIVPQLGEKLGAVGKEFLENIKEALVSQDLELKFDLYANAADTLSDDFLDYVNGDPEPMPVLDAHLKFFHEYISYLLQECVVDKYEGQLKSLLKEVDDTLKGQNEKEKLRVLDIFDDVSTDFGNFLNEKVIGYEIYKFGE